MKACKLKYSPYTVRRSVENTAMPMTHDVEFAHGHGLIQVDKAFEHLLQWCDEPETNVNFVVSVGNVSYSKGILLRGNYGHSNRIHETSVELSPVFLNADQAGELSISSLTVFSTFNVPHFSSHKYLTE
jgi:tripeptidyl-peptidase-2